MEKTVYKDNLGREISVVPYMCIRNGYGPGMKMYFYSVQGANEQYCISNDDLQICSIFEDAQTALNECAKKENWEAIPEQIPERIHIPLRGEGSITVPTKPLPGRACDPENDYVGTTPLQCWFPKSFWQRRIAPLLNRGKK